MVTYNFLQFRYIVSITRLKKKNLQYITHRKSHSSPAISTSSTLILHLTHKYYALICWKQESCQVMLVHYIGILVHVCMTCCLFYLKNLVFSPEYSNFSHHTPPPFSFSFLSETDCSYHRTQIDLCQRNLDQWMLEFP